MAMSVSPADIEERTGKKWLFRTPPELLGEKLNWAVIARNFIEKNPLHYDSSCIWWSWDWKTHTYQIIDETDLLIYVDEATQRNNLRSNIKAELLEAFRREARKNKPLDVPKTWIQFKDKIVDLQTGETREPESKYFLTNSIPHNLGSSTHTPQIDALLAEWAGDYALTLKQIIAYCLLRDYPLHRIFLLVGSGSNGKGTYLRMMNAFIGENNIASTELDLITSNQFHITKLHKKLVCQMNETNFSALKNTSMLKRLSGGDLVGFEYKNKQPFDDYNYAKIIIATNSIPVTHDRTDGFYRRWLIIDFNQKFGEKKNVLAELPETEYENLGLWCAQELKRLLVEREFYLEGTIDERKNRYESRSNPLKAFLETNYTKDINGVVPSSQFYDEVEKYLQDHGHRVLSYNVVRTMMKDEGYEYEKQRVHGYESPIAVIVGLKKKDSVPDVPNVPPLILHSHTREYEVKTVEQMELLEHVSLITQIKDYVNTTKYAGKPVPIDVLTSKFNLTEQTIQHFLKTGALIEVSPGWVVVT